MNKKSFHSIVMFLTAVLVIALVSCNPASKYEKAEKESISNYLNNHPTDTFTLETSGLYYHQVLLGTGPAPVTHDTAYVVYTGKFLDGTVFDSNVGEANLIFPVNEGVLIQGFDEGITYMKQGGKAQFLLPSKLAYGTQGYYTIGGYTPLIYDVELVLVKPGPGK
jgi:FKBP-type peptidyl-prolyl cis-trans isomerase FkpA